MTSTPYSPVHLELADLMSQSQEAHRLRLTRKQPVAQQTNTARSRLRGRGMEFEEVRAYTAGDDVRSIDWRVTARTNAPYTKIFTEERERPVIMVSDIRANMLFATRGALKSVISARASALMGWMGIHNHERIGGLIIDDAGNQLVKPARGKQAAMHLFKNLQTRHAQALIDYNAQKIVSKQDGFLNALKQLRTLATPGSLIFIHSDFNGFDEACEQQLKLLGKHCELGLNFIFDPFEAELPAMGVGHFRAKKDKLALNTNSTHVRAAYASQFEQHEHRLHSFARANAMHFVSTCTADNLADQLRHQFEVSKI